MVVINIKEKLGKFYGHFDPKIIAELNNQHIKLVKFKGDFIWHSHKDEDELFFVIKGNFFMDFRDKTVELREGEMIVVPKGTEHKPRAVEEVHIMLFEPAGTLNTGNAESDLRKNDPEWV